MSKNRERIEQDGYDIRRERKKKQGKENKLEDSVKDQSFDPLIFISSISFSGFLSCVSRWYLFPARKTKTYGGDTVPAKSLKKASFIIKNNYQ